jgi:Flp pilus assembly protein TadD
MAQSETNQASRITDIERYLTENPRSAEAHHQLGILYQTQGRKTEALRHLQEAARLDTTTVGYLRTLADFTYVDQGNAQEAVGLYQTVLEQNPNDVEVLTILGNVYVAHRQFEEACEMFNTIVRVEPWNSHAKKMTEAITRQFPTNGGPHTYAEARAAAEAGHVDEATAILERLLQRDPAHAMAHNDLGVLAASSGENDRAVEHYRRALQLQPNNQTFKKNLADLYYCALGEYQEALQLYNEILTENPRDVEVLVAIGSVCHEMGQLEDARSFFQTAATLEPQSTVARQALQRLLAPAAVTEEMPDLPANPRVEEMLKEKERHARQYFNDVLAQDPANADARRNLNGLPEVSSPTGNLYAESTRLVAAGNTGEAISMLHRILAIDPTFALAHNDLAVLLGNSGDSSQTRVHYEQAVALQPENPLFRKNLADFYFAVAGDPKRALEQYVALLRTDPRDIETLASLGQVCYSVGNTADARSFFETALSLEPWNKDVREALSKLPS